MSQTFKILVGRWDEFTTAFAALEKKAKKLGTTVSYERVDAPFHETRSDVDFDGQIRKRTVLVQEVVVFGEPPMINGWSFIAKIDINGTQPLIHTVPGYSVEERFLCGSPDCEHCKRNRARKDLFILRHYDDGRQMQVGRSCLKDFLGCNTPEGLAKRFTFFANIRECVAGFDDFRKEGPCNCVEDVLATAASSVRRKGWRKSSDNKSTASDVRVTLDQPMWARVVSGEDFEKGKAVLKWIREELAYKNDGSDYIRNLIAATADDIIYNNRGFGIVVSAISAYDRHIASLQPKIESEWIGTPGERLRGVDVQLTRVTEIGGDSRFGQRYALTFKHEKGIITWFTTAGYDLEQGQLYTVDFTVKAHNQFRDIKQTIASRLKWTVRKMEAA